MDALIMTAQVLLSLSILVTLHELGHFVAARMFNIKVDRFYLFFDFLFPLPNVLNFALFKTKRGDTEYGIGWFPLGGYVSIAGMIDETAGREALQNDPQPWEFRSKPAWQRLLVMMGGIIVNIILGVLIFWGLSYKNGENYVSMNEVNKNGIYAGALAQKIGLQTGDKIMKVNGKTAERYDHVVMDLISNSNASLTIERNGESKDIFIPNSFTNELIENKAARSFIEPIAPFDIVEVVASVKKETGLKAWLKTTFQGFNNDSIPPAAKAGLKVGDKILAVNHTSINFYHELKNILAENANKTVKMAVIHANKTTDTLTVLVSSAGTIGIGQSPLLQQTHHDYGLGEAFIVGSTRAYSVISDNIKGFGRIFRGEVAASNALSGPVGIAKMFGSVWDWNRFWNLTGMLSMVLAFMNALPIPALDGGHAIILLGEMATGRKPSEKFLETMQMIGTIIVLALMVFAFGNDLLK